MPGGCFAARISCRSCFVASRVAAPWPRFGSCLASCRPDRVPHLLQAKNAVADSPSWAVTALAAGPWFAGVLPFGEAPANPYDGLWKISIFDLSGCLNDTPRGYTITVRHGKFDEPTELFPKKGLVTPSGVLSIKATDRSGNVVSTQTATVVGDTGIGNFQGRTPRAQVRLPWSGFSSAHFCLWHFGGLADVLGMGGGPTRIAKSRR